MIKARQVQHVRDQNAAPARGVVYRALAHKWEGGRRGCAWEMRRLALANAVDIRYRNIVRHLIERLNGKADVVSWDLRAASLKVVIL